MKISICIPQYNRTQYLLKALASIEAQTYRNIEIVVSDDCSKDESHDVVPKALRAMGLEHTYLWQEKNLGYDKNLRMVLGAATGDYLFILGNDDALATEDTVASLVAVLERYGRPEVAYGNLCEWGNKKNVVRRAQRTGIVGAGPEVALKTFRSFSVVAGLIIRRDSFMAHDTDRWDQSIYVQVYLMCRIVAEGGRLLAIETPLVSANITVGDAKARNYMDILAERRWALAAETGGLKSMAQVAADAITDCVDKSKREGVVCRLYSQTLAYPYPYWLYEYRRNGLLRYAFNLSLGCVPSRLLAGRSVSLSSHLKLLFVYLRSTLGGLFVPLCILKRLKAWMYERAKRLDYDAA